GEHGIYYGHHRCIYDQALRVPMIVHCPKVVRPGIVISKEVAVLDVYKTIMEAVGLQPRYRRGGFDLIALANQTPDTYQRILLSNVFGVKKVTALRTDNWKFVQYAGPPVKNELYDVIHDPDETNNLFTAQPDIARQFQEKMAHELNRMDLP